MPTRSRKRRNFDMGRLRDAIRGPGADTRVWTATARIDDDPDAISFVPGLGWIVDVTFYGGPLDQEGPVPCKMGESFAQQFATKSDPPGRGCEVLVEIPDGDANSNPVIVARMHNEGGCEVPLLVNLTPITEDYALANHIVVTPHGADEQYGGDRRVTAPSQLLEAETVVQMIAPTIFIGGTAATPLTPAIPPTQPAVQGTLLVTAQAELVQALNVYAGTLGGGFPATPSFPVTTALTGPAAVALVSALIAYTTAVTATLSSRTLLD